MAEGKSRSGERSASDGFGFPSIEIGEGGWTDQPASPLGRCGDESAGFDLLVPAELWSLGVSKSGRW